MEESITDKLHRIYDKFKDKFPYGGFHTTLWQIMINQNFKNKKCCFTPVYRKDGFNMGIAHGPDGYTPSTAWFKNDMPYNEASDICEEMNKEVFGINPEEVFKTYAKSTWLKPEQKN